MFHTRTRTPSLEYSGNTATCSPDNGNKDIKGMVYVFIRDGEGSPEVPVRVQLSPKTRCPTLHNELPMDAAQCEGFATSHAKSSCIMRAGECKTENNQYPSDEKKLFDISSPSPSAHTLEKCLKSCQAHQSDKDVTGCEVKMSDGCYVHYDSNLLGKTDGSKNRVCWAFSECSSETSFESLSRKSLPKGT